jgi:hypothetical protein
MVAEVFHRISTDLCMYPMFFQLSLFVLFEQIICHSCPSESVLKFASDTMNQFFVFSQSNKSLVVESLFWKSKGLIRQLVGEAKPVIPLQKPDTGSDSDAD